MESNKLKIKEMPAEERPYEKCAAKGAGVLTDSELLAVIIRTGRKGEASIGLAAHVLSMHEGGILGLNHLSYKELREVKGIGHVKAIQLLCLSELTRRMSKAVNEIRLCFDNPDSIAAYYMEDMRHLEKEQLLMVLLDAKSRRIGEQIISIGTVNSSFMSPREIFIVAVKHSAVSIVLLHNHPSGDPAPSPADINSTKNVYEAGILLGIKLIDHIIIGDNKYTSMKRMGMF